MANFDRFILTLSRPLFIPTNSSEKFPIIEKSTKLDIAGKLMDYIEKNVTPTEPNKKRKIKRDSIGA